MNKRNFYVGMGMGLAVGGLAAWTMRPKKPTVKTMAGRALKTMGEVADAVTELLGLPQSIMEIYGQGLQRSMAQILPGRLKVFYQGIV